MAIKDHWRHETLSATIKNRYSDNETIVNNMRVVIFEDTLRVSESYFRIDLFSEWNFRQCLRLFTLIYAYFHIVTSLLYTRRVSISILSLAIRLCKRYALIWFVYCINQFYALSRNCEYSEWRTLTSVLQWAPFTNQPSVTFVMFMKSESAIEQHES